MTAKEVGIWTGGILVGLLALGSILPDPEPDAITAQVDCEAFVRRRLVSPTSAEFAPSPAVTDRGGGRWTVRVEVDADNIFGAHLRKHFTCDLHYVGQTPVADRVAEE